MQFCMLEAFLPYQKHARMVIASQQSRRCSLHCAQPPVGYAQAKHHSSFSGLAMLICTALLVHMRMFGCLRPKNHIQACM